MFRFNMRPRYAHKDAQTAGDLVRYFERVGEFAPKEQAQDPDIAYMARTRPDTVEYGDLVGEPIVRNLPDWARNDAGLYFKAASANEWTDGPYAIAFQIALPRGWTHAQHMALADDFCEAVMHDKVSYMVKHEPVQEGVGQPHLHILMGLRNVDGIERDEWREFRRFNRKSPERSGAQKDRFWNQRQAPRQVRDTLSDLVNFHAERNGYLERVDPRSLRKQGIDRERISWANPQTLDPATLAKEQAKAVQAWEQRKAHKGIEDIHAIPREEFVLLVRQWTRGYEPGPAVMTNTERQQERQRGREHALEAQQAVFEAQMQALEQEYATVNTEANRVHARVMMEQHREQQRSQGRARQAEVDLDKVWEQPIIANQRTGIYHTPDHPHYGSMNPKNREEFPTAREAEAAGYRAAKNLGYEQGKPWEDRPARAGRSPDAAEAEMAHGAPRQERGRDRRSAARQAAPGQDPAREGAGKRLGRGLRLGRGFGQDTDDIRHGVSGPNLGWGRDF